MTRVVAIDHLSIRVSDYERSNAFYGKLFEFLGFRVSEEYPDGLKPEGMKYGEQTEGSEADLVSRVSGPV